MERKLQCGQISFQVLVLVSLVLLITIKYYQYQDTRSYTHLFKHPVPKPPTIVIEPHLDHANYSDKKPVFKNSTLDCWDNSWTIMQNNYSSSVIFKQTCNVSTITNVVTKNMELFHTEMAGSKDDVTVHKDSESFTWILYGNHHLESPLNHKFWIHTNNVKVFTVQMPPITTSKQWQALGLDVQKIYASLPPAKMCLVANVTQLCHHHLNITAHMTLAPVNIHQNYDLFPFHVHRIHDAFVDSTGNVHSENVDLIPWQCKQKKLSVAHEYKKGTEQIHTVFVTSQNWGNAYFHRTIECTPRLAIFVDFLRRHPDIKIHINHNSDWGKLQLKALGLPNEIVTGAVHADVVYLPQGGGCGSTHPLAVPILQQLYSHLPARSTNKCERRSIVLIKRYKKRWLAQSDAILKLLHELVSETGYEVQVFSDHPQSPTFSDTVSTFSHAALVVGAHGAGMANLIFAQPQTYILEIQCSMSDKPVLSGYG